MGLTSRRAESLGVPSSPGRFVFRSRFTIHIHIPPGRRQWSAGGSAPKKRDTQSFGKDTEMSRRSFTREFKLDVCRKAESGESSKSRLCREHALSPSMLDRWIEQFRAKGEEA
ncbi:MAG: transposase, partial [Nitrospirae bacterium]|nr:transposase [Fimbriimonadaceae bacterium]